MSIKNLQDLFEHLLQDIYYAEKQIKKTLSKMKEHATDEKLANAFETHLEETEEHISKLETVFDMTGFEKDTEKCEAIIGLLKEGNSLIEECESGSVCDAALIVAAQKVEHYEIASYGALCNMAKLLGEQEAAEILHEILEQEKSADQKLTDMSDFIEEEAMARAA